MTGGRERRVLTVRGSAPADRSHHHPGVRRLAGRGQAGGSDQVAEGDLLGQSDDGQVVGESVGVPLGVGPPAVGGDLHPVRLGAGPHVVGPGPHLERSRAAREGRE